MGFRARDGCSRPEDRRPTCSPWLHQYHGASALEQAFAIDTTVSPSLRHCPPPRNLKLHTHTKRLPTLRTSAGPSAWSRARTDLHDSGLAAWLHAPPRPQLWNGDALRPRLSEELRQHSHLATRPHDALGQHRASCCGALPAPVLGGAHTVTPGLARCRSLSEPGSRPGSRFPAAASGFCRQSSAHMCLVHGGPVWLQVHRSSNALRPPVCDATPARPTLR